MERDRERDKEELRKGKWKKVKRLDSTLYKDFPPLDLRDIATSYNSVTYPADTFRPLDGWYMNRMSFPRYRRDVTKIDILLEIQSSVRCTTRVRQISSLARKYLEIAFRDIKSRIAYTRSNFFALRESRPATKIRYLYFFPRFSRFFLFLHCADDTNTIFPSAPRRAAAFRCTASRRLPFTLRQTLPSGRKLFLRLSFFSPLPLPTPPFFFDVQHVAPHYSYFALLPRFPGNFSRELVEICVPALISSYCIQRCKYS